MKLSGMYWEVAEQNVDSVLQLSRWLECFIRDRTAGVALEPPTLDVTTIHDNHGDFVFRCLQWLGVRPSDVEDVAQEVFLRVHRRLHTYDRQKPIRPWLFGICRKLADHHRRRAYLRREVYSGCIPEPACDEETHTPEDDLVRMQRRAYLNEVLDQLKDIHRATLVMREIEGMECKEIADALGVPEGTVHSRLSKARDEFQKALLRRSKGGRI